MKTPQEILDDARLAYHILELEERVKKLEAPPEKDKEGVYDIVDGKRREWVYQTPTDIHNSVVEMCIESLKKNIVYFRNIPITLDYPDGKDRAGMIAGFDGLDEVISDNQKIQKLITSLEDLKK